MKKEFLDKIKNNLIVSCQALEEEPLHGSIIMGKMALAAKEGGAVAIRANGVDDIIAIKKEVNLPIIGLIKANYKNKERYITPTLKEIDNLIKLQINVIAIDATLRDGETKASLKEKVEHIQKHGILAMADISTLEEGLIAEELGFDLVSTTLSGYTPYSKQNNGPDFNLVKRLSKKVSIPVIAEGKISNERDLRKMIRQNPYAIVIGGAITRPQQITKKYASLIKDCMGD